MSWPLYFGLTFYPVVYCPRKVSKTIPEYQWIMNVTPANWLPLIFSLPKNLKWKKEEQRSEAVTELKACAVEVRRMFRRNQFTTPQAGIYEKHGGI